MSKIAICVCEMHIFVNMNTAVDKFLLLFKENICNGKLITYKSKDLSGGGLKTKLGMC